MKKSFVFSLLFLISSLFVQNGFADQVYPVGISNGTTVEANSYIESPNHQFQLWMQTDGNLVLYNLANGAAEWSSGTYGQPGLRAVMQSDGNLVLYDDANSPHWASNTENRPLSFLNVQDDGNLVIYQLRPVWDSGTWSTPFTQSDNMGGSLFNGAELGIGDSISSGNGEYRLVMQGDSNLVLYRNSDNQSLWASNSQGSGAIRAVMQGDGNFVLYNAANQAVWATNTENKPGSILYLQNDGNLVVYSPHAIWEKGHLIVPQPRTPGTNLWDNPLWGSIIIPMFLNWLCSGLCF